MEKPTQAFGAPGTEPRWTHGAKDAVGTAYSTSSHIWFTLFRGVLNEVYYPTIDKPQIRDLQFLIAGPGFVHEEKRHLEPSTEHLAPDSLGFRVVMKDPHGRYQLIKEIIADPHLPCLLVHTKLQAEPSFLSQLKVYLLVAPHLDGDGWGDSGYAATVAGRDILTARGDHTWLAIAASRPFLKRSCGYVGYSDGWQDITRNHEMTWEFPKATDGNIALTAELDPGPDGTFTIGVALGEGLHRATSTLFQSLGIPFSRHKERYHKQWERAGRSLLPLEKASHDRGALYRASHSLILAHEDKSYPGAMIASLSIPWGDAKGDEDLGGYHLVWTRDLCHCASALLSCGDKDTPLRSLIYLACTQRQDGGFYKNFWIDGKPYSYEVPLDDVAHPVILAWRLKEQGGLCDFDPYSMVLAAAGYLVRNGPCTTKERWEEISGYSPSTLAVTIAALLCAASFARDHNDPETALFLEEWADFLEARIEQWTFTTQGELHPEVKGHYVRARPHAEDGALLDIVTLTNQPPGAEPHHLAWRVIDAGFLELVRYGIRAPNDPKIEDSLRVVDSLLKVETPHGPVWRRFPYDGYGQQDDGEPFVSYGRGRAWPLLTAERGLYELACGRDASPYLQTLERLASHAKLLPQQVWDTDDIPQRHMHLGESTGAAQPFLWAHAEYIQLLRSSFDRASSVVLPFVQKRYSQPRKTNVAVWKWDHQLKELSKEQTLRVQAEAPFVLHYSFDGGQTKSEAPSKTNPLGVHWVDLSLSRDCDFTFYWPESQHWEGKNFHVALR